MNALIEKTLRQTYRFLRHPRNMRKGRLRAWLGGAVVDRGLWTLHREKMAWGLAAGLFIAIQPLPMQTLWAVALCIWRRWNVPMAILACWFTNPLTAVITYGPSWVLGKWMLYGKLEWNFSLGAALNDIKAFSLGSLVAGPVWALAGFFLVQACFGMIERSLERRRLVRAAARDAVHLAARTSA